MVGEVVEVPTLGGQITGTIIEETPQSRWIRSADGRLFVIQEFINGKWEVTVTGQAHCFDPARPRK